MLNYIIPSLARRGHRMLVFSSSTRMLDLIQLCVLRTNKIKFLRVDGRVELAARELKIKKFEDDGRRSSQIVSNNTSNASFTDNAGSSIFGTTSSHKNNFSHKFSVMCLSTTIGGVGLTLTSADRVILVEPNW